MSLHKPFVLVLAVLVFVTACTSSGGDEVSIGTPAPEPTATATIPATETAAAPTPTPQPSATTTPVTPTPEAETAQPSATAAPATPTPDATPDPADQPALRVVNLYWLRDGALAVGGDVIVSATPARAAIEALLRGPGYISNESGMTTAIPNDVQLLDLSIANGRAIVDLSPEFEAVSLGTSGELAMVAQVVFTLTQFVEVDSVDIRIDGVDRDDILSHGLGARGLTREDFYDSTAPEIVVERPVEGHWVWAPFRVSGFSRTFESNVQWELVDSAGAVIASGFTTARQPDVGRHGPFEFMVEIEGPVWGADRLSVFETSAQDGSRINAYDVSILVAGTGLPAPAADSLPWLRADGIGPVDFGVPVEEAQAILEETFGPPLKPAGPVTCDHPTRGQVIWEGFRLNLSDEGTVEGWYYRASDPPMMTPTEVAPGMTREDLVGVHGDVKFYRDNLGTEFSFTQASGVTSGFATDDGEHVTALYAGWTCFLR